MGPFVLVHHATPLPEPKAVHTGVELVRLAGLPMGSDRRLNEVRRPFVDGDSAFAENVKRYLSGAAVGGWEEQTAVNQRMQSLVEDAQELGLVGFVTHGTAMSLFLGHLGLVRPWDFWQGLTTPDCWLIDGSEVRRLGGEGCAQSAPGQR